jgi:hypothetical protein
MNYSQQYAPQQYAPQQYAPQQYAPQQYAPQQYAEPEKKSEGIPDWVKGLVVAAIIVGILLLIFKDDIFGSDYPTEWACVAGVDTPIRRENNANNDISCMSENAKDCVWGNCEEKLLLYAIPENAEKIKPLVCGAMHTAEYGGPGYGTPEHWCEMGNGLIAKI